MHPNRPKSRYRADRIARLPGSSGRYSSQRLLDVLHKPLDATFVVIEEVELENWGWGGLPALEYRKRRAAGSG
jgi:hypothetical protein